MKKIFFVIPDNIKTVILLIILALALRVIAFSIIGLAKESDYTNKIVNKTDLRSCYYGNGYIYDTLDYQDLARNIIIGNGFSRAPQLPTAFRSPVYPYFLALIFLIFGISSHMVIWANIFLSSITIIPLYLVTRNYWGHKAAFVGGIIYCFMPQSIFWSIGAYSEPLLTFLLLSSWAFWLKGDLQKKANIGQLIAFSILMSLIILLKIYFGGILVILMLFTRAWKRITLLTLIIFIAVAPSVFWAARNYHELGRFSVSSSGGYNFWKGIAIPLGYSTVPFYDQASDQQAKYNIEMNITPNREFMIQDSLFSDANKIIKTNLGKFPKQMLIKALLFFRIWPKHTSLIAGFIYFIPLLTIYILAFLKIVFTLRGNSNNRYGLLFPLSVFLTVFPIMIIFWDLGRFRFPFDVSIIPLSGAGLLEIIQGITRENR
jgi:4-amino-4-deoxy-L-arabinose transferase-like glycosyltransferase